MEAVKIQGDGCTDIGYQRLLNEDFYDMNNFLFVLADGIGGHNAGEIASKLAVKSVIEYIHCIDYSEFDEHTDEKKVQQIINDAVIKTNENVFKKSLQNKEFEGMGTTLVLALFQQPETIHIANVGDSRAYLLRNGKLEIITEDHSVVAAMLRDGIITKSEAKTHPFRHQLSRSIGTSKNINTFANFFKVIPEDKILLCSDGLWDVLSDEEIKNILQNHVSPKKICEDFIRKANEYNSPDNISCIVLMVTK
jgi:protein phosphatase